MVASSHMKARARNSIWVSQRDDRGPSTWAFICPLPRRNSAKLDQHWSRWHSN